MGILSRTILNSMGSFTPLRNTLTRTTVPASPRKRFIMSVFFIFTPAITVSLTETIRSPARMPTFSEGPPTMVCITYSVSRFMLN